MSYDCVYNGVCTLNCRKTRNDRVAFYVSFLLGFRIHHRKIYIFDVPFIKSLIICITICDTNIEKSYFQIQKYGRTKYQLWSKLWPVIYFISFVFKTAGILLLLLLKKKIKRKRKKKLMYDQQPYVGLPTTKVFCLSERCKKYGRKWIDFFFL